MNPEELLNVIDKNYLPMINKYFFKSKLLYVNNSDYLKNHPDLRELKRYFDKEENRLLLYKYISEDTVKHNKHDVNDGFLSFSHPENFNDPFDCNCNLSDKVSVMDSFRVLCMTTIYNNILMWSHYANYHTRFRFGYSFYDIVDQILKMNDKGVCVMGQVSYKDKRPKQVSTRYSFSYSDLKFYINATFTKFIDWQYEKEFRFVLIVDKDNIDNSYRDIKDEDIPKESHVDNFIRINCDVVERYNGVNGNGHNIITKNGPKKVTKLNKHKQKYIIHK